MAQISYRVSGLAKPSRQGSQTRRVSKSFRDTDQGRNAARAFAAGLDDVKTVYDVRTRIGNRVVTRTFSRRRDADAYAATVETDRLRGVAVDPRAGRITFGEYATAWLDQRLDLSATTRTDYSSLLNAHLLPTFGNLALVSIVPSKVRAWHAALAKDHRSRAAKAYRLLQTIMNTAVIDQQLVKNPCQVKGAGVEHTPERPVPTVAEVDALARAIPKRISLLVHLAAWCGLRRGELLGLRREDIDTLHGTLRVTRAKTPAGIRTVAIPPHVIPLVEEHLHLHVAADAKALVFTNTRGGRLWTKYLQGHWNSARKAVGVDYHFHDLRHLGATLAAATGASTKELMHRLGHASPRAALIYQHATKDRDRAIAAALSEMASPASVSEIRPDLNSSAR